MGDSMLNLLSWGRTYTKQVVNNIQRSYHVGYDCQLVYYGLRSQLSLTDHSGQEASHLEQPPFQTEHKHTGDGQVDEGPPLLQTVHRPACVRQAFVLG